MKLYRVDNQNASGIWYDARGFVLHTNQAKEWQKKMPMPYDESHVGLRACCDSVHKVLEYFGNTRHILEFYEQGGGIFECDCPTEFIKEICDEQSRVAYYLVPNEIVWHRLSDPALVGLLTDLSVRGYVPYALHRDCKRHAVVEDKILTELRESKALLESVVKYLNDYLGQLRKED